MSTLYLLCLVCKKTHNFKGSCLFFSTVTKGAFVVQKGDKNSKNTAQVDYHTTSVAKCSLSIPNLSLLHLSL